MRDAFEKYASDDYVQHNPTLGNGREAAIELIEKFVSTPGFHASVMRIITEGDFVATHMHVTFGVAPDLAVMDMWRFKNGKMVEHWDVIQEVPAQTVSGNPMF